MRADPLTQEQAEQLVNDINALDGVSGLSSGRFGEFAILYPGTRVRGLHVVNPQNEDEPQRLEIAVIARAHNVQSIPDLDALADTVRKLAAQFTSIPVDVTITDIEFAA